MMRPIYLTYKRPPQSKTSTKILGTLEEVLKDPETYELFKNIAMSHDAYECLPFYQEILEYREITDPNELEYKAQHIYNEYIKVGAKFQNNLDHRMVKDIEQRLSQPTSDLFNAPYKEIMKLLKTNFFPELQGTDDYNRIVHERERKMQEERKAKYLLIQGQK